ncbi:MAG: family 10 glycosylhydrolase [bacterium]|nr:family 10 glycosylhydrolase [bacterium]
MKYKQKKVLIIAVSLTIAALFIWKNRCYIPIHSEKRGVFISYIEYEKYFKNKSADEIKIEIKNMIKKIKEYKLNMIILQVRSFSDAIYPSAIYPASISIVSKESDKLPLDILATFIEYAHASNIEVHAWINPYRIRTSTDITTISEKNPAYQWLNTNHVKVIPDKGIYYNPASSEVKELVLVGIHEIIENYQVDGIHLDDYFYPDETIDLENYQTVKDTISLTDYRLSQTNELVQSIYQLVKEKNSKIQVGISPEGNLENNYEKNYADVKTWLSKDGYIDYIMPQLYYGFFNETKPFIETLNTWKNLIKNDVILIPALALYKAGQVDSYAKKGSQEWLESNHIIENQIKVLRQNQDAKGFSIFRYDYLCDTTNQVLKEEQINLQKILNIQTN